MTTAVFKNVKFVIFLFKKKLPWKIYEMMILCVFYFVDKVRGIKYNYRVKVSLIKIVFLS